MLRKSACSLVLLLALAACAGTRPAARLQVTAGYCDPPLPYRYNPIFLPKPDFEAALTPALLARYPRRNLLTANAAGILPQLEVLLALEETARQQPGPATELAVLRQRQRIAAQVALVSSTVSSVAAELDCEGERADQVAMLEGACREVSTAERLQTVLDRDGCMTVGSQGQPVVHPAVREARGARVSAARLLRELGIDGSEPAGDGPRVPRRG